MRTSPFFLTIPFLFLIACAPKDWVRAMTPLDDHSASARAATYPCALESSAYLAYQKEQRGLDDLLQDTLKPQLEQAKAIAEQQTRVNHAKSNWKSEQMKCKAWD